MALVDYTSSDGDDLDNERGAGEDDSIARTSLNPNNARRKRDVPSSSPKLPPLPSKFHNLYASTVRNSPRDDPSLHGGRKRVTPHIEGNWPTHIYIEWYPSTIESDLLSALISKVASFKRFSIQTFLTSDLGVPLPLHVSLSRAIGFSKHVKDAFLASLEQAIRTSGIRPFRIAFSGLAWVPNYEKTRWFLVLRLDRPEKDALNKLLHVSNKIVEEFGQPPLYLDSRTSEDGTKNAHLVQRAKRLRSKGQQERQSFVDMVDLSEAFHMSIAWTLLSPDQELIDATERLTSTELTKVKKIQVMTEEIKAKIGNVVTSVSLPVSVMEGKSLFGF
ncbi:hypothetical protein DSL72_004059 [Monilinia vaccinii-corymbosi]|uniref:U6 snRNA phosphodiesterase n=1 Tax=Monilinia vaccinii-corymbosi TaxID=61207 RepID=A0A8A3P186_9HELO|nr:hypothetical protein DSL72_004059 [Monilinia vaccinii-corymbosi]